MMDNWIYIGSQTMEKRLFADLENGNFTDVTIDVGTDGNQRTFKAHRLVLASENSEFEKLLRGSNFGIIKIPDMNPKAFENLIRYCYGENFLFKDLESIRDTYFAAEKFKAKELKLAAGNKLIDVYKSEYKGKTEKFLNELNFQLVPKGLSSKKVCPPAKNLSVESTNSAENTVSLGATEDESSQVEHESLLEEKKIVTDEVQESGSIDKKEIVEEHDSLLEEKRMVTDEVQASGSKDQKEVVVERAETIKPEDEKMSDADNDSEDEEVIREDVLKDFMVDVSRLIKNAVDCSSGKTVQTLIKEAERLSRHAAEEMQLAVDDLEDSFSYLMTCKSNTAQETEVESE